MALQELESRMVKIQGPARSGKTEAMLGHIATRIKQGANPCDIAYITQSAFAAQAARTRLAAMLDDDAKPAAAQVKMGRVVDFCVDVLSSEAAQQATGRVPRVLTPDERNFFLEDMKTMGQPVRRLRNMLNFFFAQWAKLEPEKLWLEPGEESQARELMDNLLRSEHAMLPEEVAPVCYAYLRSDEGAKARKAFSLVCVDDFQNLNRAEQDCACLLAKDQLIVAGDPAQGSGKLSCTEGFAHFEDARNGVKVVTLDQTHENPAVQNFVHTILEQGGEGPLAADAQGTGSLERIKWDLPDDELYGIAHLVEKDIAQGCFERDICVLVPNKLWSKLVATQLGRIGVKSTTAAFASRLGGDPRDAKRCAALSVWTKLCLLAQPDDMAAWRSWCGIGNYLTNSDAWMGLMDFAKQRQCDLLSAMDATVEEVAAGNDPYLKAATIAERRSEGLKLIGSHEVRRGFALLRAIGGAELPEFETVRTLMQGDETPAQLLEIARAALDAPEFDEDPHKVRVMPYDAMAGLGFKKIYAIGVINGFIPSRDAFETVSTEEARSATLHAERRQFCAAVSKASEALVVSTFSKADLELAERTKMLVKRVRADEGRRVALLEPSTFLNEAKSSCPGAVGGQSVLAELGKA